MIREEKRHLQEARQRKQRPHKSLTQCHSEPCSSENEHQRICHVRDEGLGRMSDTPYATATDKAIGIIIATADTKKPVRERASQR